MSYEPGKWFGMAMDADGASSAIGRGQAFAATRANFIANYDVEPSVMCVFVHPDAFDEVQKKIAAMMNDGYEKDNS